MSNEPLVKVYSQAIKALALRARSVKELRDKLLAKDFLPELVDAVIAKLLEQKLLNDREFTANYIRYQLSQRPLGERALSFRLHHLGVDALTIKEALKEAFSDPTTAVELARRAIRSKNVSKLPPQKQAEKLSRFLAGRGFSYATIRVIIDDLLQKE